MLELDRTSGETLDLETFRSVVDRRLAEFLRTLIERASGFDRYCASAAGTFPPMFLSVEVLLGQFHDVLAEQTRSADHRQVRCG